MGTMWPLKRQREQYVAIALCPDSLSLGLFTHGNKQFPYCLHTYQTKKFTEHELVDQTIFNNTTLIQCIKEMIHECNAENAFVMLGLDGSLVTEELVTLSTSTPSEQSFSKFFENKSLVWDYCLLYPEDQEHFIYYFCGLRQEQLFQYKLLAISCALNLICITTTPMAYLSAWQMRNNDKESFAHDMIRYKNNIQKLLGINDLVETTQLNKGISFKDPTNIYRALALLGLAKAGMTQ